jgi:hypothetical protein
VKKLKSGRSRERALKCRDRLLGAGAMLVVLASAAGALGAGDAAGLPGQSLSSAALVTGARHTTMLATLSLWYRSGPSWDLADRGQFEGTLELQYAYFLARGVGIGLNLPIEAENYWFRDSPFETAYTGSGKVSIGVGPAVLLAGERPGEKTIPFATLSFDFTRADYYWSYLYQVWNGYRVRASIGMVLTPFSHFRMPITLGAAYGTDIRGPNLRFDFGLGLASMR